MLESGVGEFVFYWVCGCSLLCMFVDDKLFDDYLVVIFDGVMCEFFE